MSVWAWFGIALVGVLLLSAVVGVTLAAMLGRISREVSDLLDLEPWASGPLTRARGSEEVLRDRVGNNAPRV
jgi:hypothetical protein